MTETQAVEAQAAPEPEALPAPEPETPPQPETSPAENGTANKMHRYSDYLHLGPDAEDCEHAIDGACTNVDHSHIWCRLPNQFERTSLSEKAAAAAARRLRVLRDPESDPRVILDGEIESLRINDQRDDMIAEITNSDFLADHLTALKEIGEEDDGEWDTIDEDRERLRALEEMAHEDRPAEEYQELSAHLAKHTELVNERRDAVQLPRKQEMEAKPIEELCEVLRDQRIDAMGTAARREEYAKWQWYVCAFKPKSPDKPGFPSERYYSSIDAFSHAPPEEIEAISELVSTLDREASENLKG